MSDDAIFLFTALVWLFLSAMVSTMFDKEGFFKYYAICYIVVMLSIYGIGWAVGVYN